MIEQNPLCDAGPVLSVADIEALEQRLGTSLPEDYRQFLLESNGGTPERAAFRVGDEPEFWVDYFYRIDDHLAGPAADAPPGTLAFWRQVLDGYLPPDAIPVACVARDSFWLLFLRGPRRGEVHLVDWDEVDEDSNEPSPEELEPAMHRVAGSFGEAFGKLYESD